MPAVPPRGLGIAFRTVHATRSGRVPVLGRGWREGRRVWVGLSMSSLFWVGFLVLVVVLLALDLGVFNRRPHVVSVKEALTWTTVWVVLSLLFNVFIYFVYEHDLTHFSPAGATELDGKTAALHFFTAYVVEKSLSLDNIFVIAMVFAYFRVPPKYQHRVLFWGVLGALVMRGFAIWGGLAVIHRFSWIIYVFGALLIFTAVKMLVTRHDTVDPEKNWAVRVFRKILPVTTEYHEAHFLVRIDGKRVATPLFLTLIIIESTDLLFAVDSIPAVFAVTTDPYIVFTSNVFAILGLRSLYFALAAGIHKFRYLQMSLVFILAFVGVKMILSHHYPINPVVSLCVILGTLVVGILASLFGPSSDSAELASPLDERRSRDHFPADDTEPRSRSSEGE